MFSNPLWAEDPTAALTATLESLEVKLIACERACLTCISLCIDCCRNAAGHVDMSMAGCTCCMVVVRHGVAYTCNIGMWAEDGTFTALNK